MTASNSLPVLIWREFNNTFLSPKGGWTNNPEKAKRFKSKDEALTEIHRYENLKRGHGLAIAVGTKDEEFIPSSKLMKQSKQAPSKNEETLYRCKDCGQEGFLKPQAHKCKSGFAKKGNLNFEPILSTAANLQRETNLTAQSSVPAGWELVEPNKEGALLAPADALASRLNASYREACDGMRRVLVFGMIALEAADTIGHNKFLPWLETNCPDIAQSTAYHFMDLTKGICEMAGIERNIRLQDKPLYEVLSLPEGELPEGAKPIRDQILSLVQDKSQRQLRQDIKEHRTAAKGGHQPPNTKVQAWLKDNHPEKAGTKWNDLSTKLKKEFNESAHNTKDKRTKEEIERQQFEDESSLWWQLIQPNLAQAVDRKLYLPMTDEALEELSNLLTDLKTSVNEHQKSRKKSGNK